MRKPLPLAYLPEQGHSGAMWPPIKLAAKIVLWTVVGAALFLAILRAYGIWNDFGDLTRDIPGLWGWLSLLTPETTTLLAIALIGSAVVTYETWWPLLRRTAGMPDNAAGAAASAEPRRNQWFLHAAFYVVYRRWPQKGERLLDSAMESESHQNHLRSIKQTREWTKALRALTRMRQAAADGDLVVWGQVDATGLRNMDMVPSLQAV
jgi:hypothetical protein